jgi:arylsulfatase A-like enzyme
VFTRKITVASLPVVRAAVFLPTLLAVIAGAVSAAGQDTLPESQPLLESPLDLLARFPVARVSLDDATLDEIPLDSARHFAGGWYQTNETEDGQLYRWMGPRAAVVDLALVEAGELAVSMSVTAPRDERVPPIRVRFNWNGQFAGMTELSGSAQTVQMTVPAGLTRPGMNRLEVIPSFWVNASKLSGGSSSSNVSVNVFRLSAVRPAPSARLAPGALPAANSDGSVVQSANTVITYYTRLGNQPGLTIAGDWMPNTGDRQSSEVIVLVRDGAGRTEIVYTSGSPGTESSFAQEIDLSDFANAFVELSTIVRQTGTDPSHPAGVVWRRISLTGDGPTDRTQAPAGNLEGRRPNVVLVVFDTLRADYTEPYGATGVHTPNFSRLAGKSLTFTNAFAPTSWTRPSVVTMLTGLHETRHGTVTIEDKLAGSVPYLPEILHDSGYRTVCISMNGHVTPQWGFDRGFDAFEDLSARREQILAAHPTPEGYLNEIWDRHVAPGIAGDDGPFFLYLHEIDPHGPYAPRPPFDAMYPTVYSGHPEIEADNINLVRLGLTELSAQDIAYLETRYRGEVSFVDAALGAIMDRLERDGLAGDTILIVTSDHGEEFGEHGGIGHMVTLYDEMLRVPLIWSRPGTIRAGREASSAGLIDAAPTLLGLLGIVPPPSMEGRDLSTMLQAEGAPRAYPILAHLTGNPVRVRRAVNWAGWKLYERDFGPESEYELYDTVRDPREITNQWTAQREVGGALRQMLEWYAHTSGAIPAAQAEKVRMESLDPELVERLRNLGYVQ